MRRSSRQRSQAARAVIDPSLDEPTGQLPIESISKLKAACAVCVATEEGDEATTVVVSHGQQWPRAADDCNSLGSLRSLTVDSLETPNAPLFTPAPRARSSRKRLHRHWFAFALIGGIVFADLGLSTSWIQLPSPPHSIDRDTAPLAWTASWLAEPTAHHAIRTQDSSREASHEAAMLRPLKTIAQPISTLGVSPRASRRAGGSQTTIPTGAVYVSTPGASADVFEGARSLGRTPQLLELPLGTHTLLLKAGDATRVVAVDATAGATALVSASFIPVAQR